MNRILKKVEKWECYNCAIEDSFENSPSGFLANYHPICLNCANKIYHDFKNPDRFRLSFHAEFGNLFFYKGHLILAENKSVN